MGKRTKTPNELRVNIDQGVGVLEEPEMASQKTVMCVEVGV